MAVVKDHENELCFVILIEIESGGLYYYALFICNCIKIIYVLFIEHYMTEIMLRTFYSQYHLVFMKNL